MRNKLSWLEIYEVISTSKHLLTVILLSLPCFGFAQQKIKDSTQLEIEKRENSFSRSLSFLATGNSFSSLGNFAALSTDEKTIKGSIFLLNRKFNMYTITVEGGASNGIGALFDEGSQGADVSLGIEHRILLDDKKGYVSQGQKALNEIKKEKFKLLDTYNDSLLVLFKRANSLNKNKLTTTTRKDEEDKLVVETCFDIAEAKKILPKDYFALEKIKKALKDYSPLVDSAGLEIEKVIEIKAELEQRKKILTERISGTLQTIISDKKKAYKKNISDKLAVLDKKEMELKTKLLNLKFFSIGAKGINKSFKYFDSSLELDKQVYSRDYTTQEISLTYTSVSNINITERNLEGKVVDFEPRTLRYFSIGTLFQRTDNLDELTKVEIEDTKFSDLTNQRVVVSKQEANIGEYKKDLKSMTFVADYYQFFSPTSNGIALHLNPKYTIKESSKPLTQFQVGLLFPFKKKDEEKTIINVEIFYQLKDVFDTLDKFDNAFFKRNIVGIQTSFPFNFNF